MNSIRKYYKEILVGGLLLSNFFVYLAIYERLPGDTLAVYFLDVGQGDAIFIETPTHNRMLIDGGRNRKVLSELGKILPFGDRRIDVVLATHPDSDHIGGFPEVLKRYETEMFFESGVESDSELDLEINKILDEKNIPQVLAKRGIVINFGDGVTLKILFPNQNVSKWETNDASIVAKLEYGEKSFLLTGDSPMKTENILIKLDPSSLDSDVLKAGHHGSRTSTSLSFTKLVSPEYTVISSGKDNSYGHPHQEVLDILEEVRSKIMNTKDLGTVEIKTNGRELYVKN